MPVVLEPSVEDWGLRGELVNLGKEWRPTSPILRLEIYIGCQALAISGQQAQRGRCLIDRFARTIFGFGRSLNNEVKILVMLWLLCTLEVAFAEVQVLNIVVVNNIT